MSTKIIKIKTYFKKELLEWLEVTQFLAYKIVTIAYHKAIDEARNTKGATMKKWRTGIGEFFLILISLYVISILTLISIPFQIILSVAIYCLFVLTKNRINKW